VAGGQLGRVGTNHSGDAMCVVSSPVRDSPFPEPDSLTGENCGICYGTNDVMNAYGFYASDFPLFLEQAQ
jgi:hypothetical protein